MDDPRTLVVTNQIQRALGALLSTAAEVLHEDSDPPEGDEDGIDVSQAYVIEWGGKPVLCRVGLVLEALTPLPADDDDEGAK